MARERREWKEKKKGKSFLFDLQNPPSLSQEKGERRRRRDTKKYGRLPDFVGDTSHTQSDLRALSIYLTIPYTPSWLVGCLPTHCESLSDCSGSSSCSDTTHPNTFGQAAAEGGGVGGIGESS